MPTWIGLIRDLDREQAERAREEEVYRDRREAYDDWTERWGHQRGLPPRKPRWMAHEESRRYSVGLDSYVRLGWGGGLGGWLRCGIDAIRTCIGIHAGQGTKGR